MVPIMLAAILGSSRANTALTPAHRSRFLQELLNKNVDVCQCVGAIEGLGQTVTAENMKHFAFRVLAIELAIFHGAKSATFKPDGITKSEMTVACSNPLLRNLQAR